MLFSCLLIIIFVCLHLCLAFKRPTHISILALSLCISNAIPISNGLPKTRNKPYPPSPPLAYKPFFQTNLFRATWAPVRLHPLRLHNTLLRVRGRCCARCKHSRTSTNAYAHTQTHTHTHARDRTQQCSGGGVVGDGGDFCVKSVYVRFFLSLTLCVCVYIDIYTVLIYLRSFLLSLSSFDAFYALFVSSFVFF